MKNLAIHYRKYIGIKLVYLTLALIFFVPLFLHLYYLSTIAIFIMGLVFLIQLINRFHSRTFPLTITVFPLILLLSVFFKIFFFELYIVPSVSMQNALHVGDYILVNKLSYGAKVSLSIKKLPWIGGLFSDGLRNFEEAAADPGQDDLRLNGTDSIRNGDIVVFKMTSADTRILVKRCLATPGQLFAIKDKTTLVAGSPLEWLTVTEHYHLDFRDSLDLSHFLKLASDRHYQSLFIRSGDTGLVATLDAGQVRWIAGCRNKVLIRPVKARPVSFPSKDLGWTTANWGTVRIPYKGFRILLNDSTYNLYHSTIEKYENEGFRREGKLFYLSDRPVTHFTFKKDYYMMMGDNRDSSYDSRMWGFVSKNNIIGKVVAKL